MKRARNIALTVIAATALLIGGVMAHRVVLSRRPHIDIDTTRYQVQGIDISAHNGYVDFDRVAKQGIDFVYIKATEGEDFRDAAFEDNYRRARAAGLAVGAYHFFRFDRKGWRQCANLLRATDGCELQLPLAIDVEEWGNPDKYTTDSVVAELRSMLGCLDLLDRRVIIYTNRNGYNRIVRPNFDSIPIWLCSFTDPPIADDRRWVLWQYSHLGRIDGIEGDVDLNTFNGSRRDFARFIAGD